VYLNLDELGTDEVAVDLDSHVAVPERRPWQLGRLVVFARCRVAC